MTIKNNTTTTEINSETDPETIVVSGQEMTAKTVEIFSLLDKGLDIEQAYRLVKPDKAISQHGKAAIMRKYKQYSLTNPTRVKKASKIVDNCLAGKPLTRNTEEIPSNNQILAMVKEIMDRAEPKVQRNENLNINAHLAPVDLSKYKLR